MTSITILPIVIMEIKKHLKVDPPVEAILRLFDELPGYSFSYLYSKIDGALLDTSNKKIMDWLISNTDITELERIANIIGFKLIEG